MEHIVKQQPTKMVIVDQVIPIMNEKMKNMFYLNEQRLP
jgi:hypothetical protein